ncbi:MAG: alpha/beta hydrolase [Actinobacteria bacterium]|nr:alpha/beta hydrolase [Actinomycetota bacterium]
MKVPFYIGTGDEATFAVLHPAEEPRSAARPPVLICPPWGWTDVASYRARREWADRLAAAGFPTLRFDLPATGNSAGRPSDSGIIGSWVSATLAAATWLADAEGAGGGIAALGIGVGGLLAMAAIVAGAPIAALALWGTPGRGKRFVRETQAFSRMQPWQAGESDKAGFDPGVPDGWMEAGGFLLSPETLAELKAIEAEAVPGSALRRALLLDRDGIPVDPELATALEGAGVEVESAPGVGWEGFVSHPEQALVPAVTAARVERWLAGEPTVPVEPAPAPESGAVLNLDFGRESVISLDEAWGRTVGILTEPAGGAGDDLCGLFFNAGAVRSVGPNRMWAETARRWAAQGVPSLRVDLQGIGDADGEPAGALQIGDFYADHYAAQVSGLLDELERRGLGKRFVLVGLCSGGYWSFRTAVDDPRVVAALAVNAGALRWVPDLPRRREAHRTSRALEGRWWRKLLHGEIEPSRIAQLMRAVAVNSLALLRRAVRRLLGRGGGPLKARIEGDLDVLRDRGVHLLLAFSDDEPLGEEVERDHLRERASRWPNVEFATLPGNDHTLRPLAAQRAAGELLDAELARLTATPSPSAR